eukprot:305406-Amphidinium_carterae.2
MMGRHVLHGVKEQEVANASDHATFQKLGQRARDTQGNRGEARKNPLRRQEETTKKLRRRQGEIKL